MKGLGASRGLLDKSEVIGTGTERTNFTAVKGVYLGKERLRP